MIETPAGITKM